ncbi:MAG: nitroreductase family protein [Rikenellaceae bacterium]
MVEAIKQHRSIRSYIADKEIPEATMLQLIEAASRASTTGGMQLYSIIVSTSQEMKEKLSPLHFNQPMVKSCSAVVTICADVARFSQWCELRGAEPSYHNFAWWVNAAIDALLAAQNFCTEAESEGLGICYLGTTIYTTEKLIETLELPRGVIPVTTIVVGYPQITPSELTPRLPLEAIYHKEKYTAPSTDDINSWWQETERSEQTKTLLEVNAQPTLAHVFTENRYKKADNLAISESYFAAIKSQGFI